MRTHTLQVTISPERMADRANERVDEYFSQGDRAVEERIAQTERVVERLEEQLGERIEERIAYVGRLGEGIDERLAHGLEGAAAAGAGAGGYTASSGSMYPQPVADQQQRGAPIEASTGRTNAPATTGSGWVVPEVRVNIFNV